MVTSESEPAPLEPATVTTESEAAPLEPAIVTAESEPSATIQSATAPAATAEPRTMRESTPLESAMVIIESEPATASAAAIFTTKSKPSARGQPATAPATTAEPRTACASAPLELTPRPTGITPSPSGLAGIPRVGAQPARQSAGIYGSVDYRLNTPGTSKQQETTALAGVPQGYCPICGTQEASEAALRIHAARRHLPWFAPVDSACFWCSSNMLTPEDLQAHVHRDHPDMLWLLDPIKVAACFCSLMEVLGRHFYAHFGGNCFSPGTLLKTARSIGGVFIPATSASRSASYCVQRMASNHGISPVVSLNEFPANSVLALESWQGLLWLMWCLKPEARTALMAAACWQSDKSKLPPSPGQAAGAVVTSYSAAAERPTTSQPRPKNPPAAMVDSMTEARLREVSSRQSEGPPRYATVPLAWTGSLLNTQLARPIYVDAHCHLDRLEEFKAPSITNLSTVANRVGADDRRLVAVATCFLLKRAAVKGTFEIPTPSEGLLQDQRIGTTVGLHPKFAGILHSAIDQKNAVGMLIASLRRLDLSVIGVGEVGLDYSQAPKLKNNGVALTATERDTNLQKTQENQRRTLKSILVRVAKTPLVNLPLVMHVRDGAGSGHQSASQDCLAILKELAPKARIYRHCYDGPLEQAQQWLQAYPDMFFGISSKVFRNDCHRETRSVFAELPLENIIVETDAGYLKGMWGNDATPFAVCDVYEWLRAARNDAADCCQVMENNFARLYPQFKARRN